MRFKSNLEIVTGFLGSGKTTFINSLVKNTLVHGEKLLIIECEQGQQKLSDAVANNKQIIVKALNPQENFSGAYLKRLLDIHTPHRVIIEHNGSRRLEDLLKVIEENSIEKIAKLFTIYNVTDAITYELFINNMGNLILDSIYNSNLIILNHSNRISKEKANEITEQLGRFNSNAYIIPLEELSQLDSVFEDTGILFNGYIKKLNIRIKNFLK